MCAKWLKCMNACIYITYMCKECRSNVYHYTYTYNVLINSGYLMVLVLYISFTFLIEILNSI